MFSQPRMLFRQLILVLTVGLAACSTPFGPRATPTLPPPTPTPAPATPTPPPLAAIVNGEYITKAEFEAELGRYRDAHTAYQQRAQAHNDAIQQWNARGGVTREAHASLEAERGQLDGERRRLEAERVALGDLAASVKALADKGNAIAQEHNQAASTFNSLYGEPRQFHKGEFNGREISVFEFHDERDLLLLLVHELGHALGLGHADDPAAVMHAMAGGQVLDPLALADADRTLLRARCRRL